MRRGRERGGKPEARQAGRRVTVAARFSSPVESEEGRRTGSASQSECQRSGSDSPVQFRVARERGVGVRSSRGRSRGGPRAAVGEGKLQRAVHPGRHAVRVGTGPKGIHHRVQVVVLGITAWLVIRKGTLSVLALGDGRNGLQLREVGRRCLNVKKGRTGFRREDSGLPFGKEGDSFGSRARRESGNRNARGDVAAGAFVFSRDSERGYSRTVLQGSMEREDAGADMGRGWATTGPERRSGRRCHDRFRGATSDPDLCIA
ncbi:uncharacterized protein LOC115091956 isoform X1 [Rhinatrema bivittatum]|uniref:uncharacterized protein LOC115091956 isoform X1 n=1 Tax=Rhinatrema bivittatum TaxID=194408 RepID=UPI001128D458|nr:uncharacterized protein LOC115091956 isoform X1 [Rhinatrema bivittatum]